MDLHLLGIEIHSGLRSLCAILDGGPLSAIVSAGQRHFTILQLCVLSASTLLWALRVQQQLVKGGNDRLSGKVAQSAASKKR